MRYIDDSGRTRVGPANEPGVLREESKNKVQFSICSDRDLVRAYLAGEHAAWETLMHRYKRLIYSVPVRSGLSPDDAEDVYLGVCVKLLEHLEQLRDRDRLAGWLMATAAHETRRVQRASRRCVPLPDASSDEAENAAEDTLVDTDPMPDEVVAHMEEAHLVRQAVEQLDDRCRALLGLLYHAELPLSYAEIARRLEMPEGSVGPTRARCLLQLRRVLQRMGF